MCSESQFNTSTVSASCTSAPSMCVWTRLPEDGGFVGPSLEPPSELLDEGFASRLEVIFMDPKGPPALGFPLGAAAAFPGVAFCALVVGFLALAVEPFRLLPASASAMQAPCWGGNGGRSLTGAGGGS